MNSKFKTIANAIHKQLHNNGKGLKIDGKPYPVKTGRNGCKYITYDGKTFIQQDPSRHGVLAERVKRGEHLTRIVRSGKPWGWISDTEIHDPLDGE